MKRINEAIDSGDKGNDVNRRNFIAKTALAGAGIAITALPRAGRAQTTRQDGRTAGSNKPGNRKLGQLEVSSVGLGVQNMSRTYHTTIPTRAEMINIIRTAYDRGVTFFEGQRLPDAVLVFSGVEAPPKK